ncbi:MAG: DUF4194 domain-containing protein [Actinobacteria bacterium]|jgi:hypothetical protein|uniref:Unannotated protein n=1 Tax=freshwater metagenome TaxID=449393 RepID=A0A6J7J1C4_9ZZZZ|nr:DUF4194 domain-containing protein [Actinomycetota bacterium]
MTATPAPSAELDLPLVVTSLMRGVVYRDDQEVAWRHLLALQSQVRDHVEVLGLVVVIDETEGFAFLRSAPVDPEVEESSALRLVARRPLSFHQSLLLALLRKRLAQFDADASDTRLILTRDQIVEMLTVFMPARTTQTRMVDQIDSHIAKAIDLGFLRRVQGSEGVFEVRRILKAFVDGQWLSEFEERLAQYALEFAVPEES